jgi:PLD-like domain
MSGVRYVNQEPALQKKNVFHLLPHTWQGEGAAQLGDEYKRAFSRAKQLHVVSAFLTEWPSDLPISDACTEFRLVVGTDFGTTRLAAVESAIGSLPKRFKGNVQAFNQRGVSFHPKAVLWREPDGQTFILIGSSNLTRAAFESNVEANVTLQLTDAEYTRARAWVQEIEDRSVPVNAAWLRKYVEAPARGGFAGSKSKVKPLKRIAESPIFDLALELRGRAERQLFARQLQARRAQRAMFDAHSRKPLVELLKSTAAKRRWSEANNLTFYDELVRLWAGSEVTRLGGLQWVMLGKHADHQQLAKSLVAILDAPPGERDAVVIFEKDRLHSLGVSTRAAVLTELLCHLFPSRYPILDAPVRLWRATVGFDRRVPGTEGERYVRLAEAMRAALKDPGPVGLGIKNLAELDTLIWVKFKRE